MSLGKALLWIGGGVLLLGCAGVVFLYGAASLAMWKSAKSIEKEQAAQEAAFKAMTPEQHLEMARKALEEEHSPSFCLGILKSVPEGTPGRAELAAEATRQQEAESAKQAAFDAMTPDQHFAAAKAALEAGDPYGARGHLMWVPKDTPGRAEVVAEADRKAEALESAKAPHP